MERKRKMVDEALTKSKRITIKHALTKTGPVVSESRTSTLNEIMMALTQPNNIKLGVYGSSVAGQGRVVEIITRRANRDNLFDEVVKASVMKRPSLKRIQGELGRKLGLQLREKTIEGRARLLCDRIKTVGKILIILDDFWGEINLGRIGIPFGNDHLGCKILLVSESQEALSNQVDTQLQFSVEEGGSSTARFLAPSFAAIFRINKN